VQPTQTIGVHGAQSGGVYNGKKGKKKQKFLNFLNFFTLLFPPPLTELPYVKFIVDYTESVEKNRKLIQRQ